MQTENLKKIITELKAVVSEIKLKVSDDKIFEEAMSLLISEQIQTAYDKRDEARKQGFTAGKSEQRQEQAQDTPEMASDKQISYLVSLGYQGGVEGLTKLEASNLIKEYKAKPKAKQPATEESYY